MRPTTNASTPPRIKWALSRADVHDVTKQVTDLLRICRLHGHKYAIDAVLAAVARTAPHPVTVLTFDPEDLTLLCGPTVEIVKV